MDCGQRNEGWPFFGRAVDAGCDSGSEVPAEEGDYVFQWRGERIDDCNTLAFQTAVKAAKLGPLRWHDLRHTWAS